MVVAMFVKNGKNWKLPIQQIAKETCPFDNAELKLIYPAEQVTGFMTEYPEDLLPKSFKKANVHSYHILECATCQKRFIMWENNGVQINEFELGSELELHEIKVLPDGDYTREDENNPEPQKMPDLRTGQATEADLEDLEKTEKFHFEGSYSNDPKKQNRPEFYG